MPPVQNLLDQRIRSDVLSMHAYKVQDANGMVKLDAMENPYSLPKSLQEKLGQRLGSLALNRYPDTRIHDLHKALADYVGMPNGCDMVLGNGSDELISLLSLACARPANTEGKRPMVLAPVPGFVMYAVSAQLQGLDFEGVPLCADFSLNTAAMCNAIALHQPAIVYLAYPNNPTATLWNEEDMASVIQAAAQTNSIVVVDEAYQPFSSRSYIDQMRKHPEQHNHVVLMRTLSKFGLAGVRLGYMLGHSALIKEIDKVRPPYNISILNCECALFALEHADVFAAQAANICAERTRLTITLRRMQGVTVWDSDANMILIRLEKPQASADLGIDSAQTVFDKLKAKGILIKNVSKMHPLLQNCLRLTVGTPAENTQMLAALQEIL